MKKLLLVIAVLLVSACASMPAADTMNKRMALVEIGYSAVLDTVALYHRENRFSVAQKKIIAEYLREVNQARDLAYIALRAGDEVDFSNRIATMNSGLALLRSFLIEIEGKNDVSTKRDRSSGFDLRQHAGCCGGYRTVAARPV